MGLQPGKYDRSIKMQCPTCGGMDFIHDDGPMVRCTKCGRTMTKDQLQDSNGERIEAELDEVKAEIMKDVTAHFKKAFPKWK